VQEYLDWRIRSGRKKETLPPLGPKPRWSCSILIYARNVEIELQKELSARDRPKVLIASYLEPGLVDRIKKQVQGVEVLYVPNLLAIPRYPADHTAPLQRTPEQESEWKALLADADVLFDFDYTHVEDLPELAPRLRWIQATSAGIGLFVKEAGYADRTPWTFTTASGIHARPLAEFVVMAMLMFVKDTFQVQRRQAERRWERYAGSELSNYTLGIVGLGKIGRETGRLAKAFDMRVVGTRRNPSGPLDSVDELFGPDDLPRLLRQSDFLSLSCPLTPETEGLIGKREIAMLPRGSVLINISRGAVVDEGAMIDALRSGQLRGAALDVFAEEPLPADSPLWSMPNVLVSPHSASTSINENERLTELFCENLNRYLKGDPLLNRLDTTRLY
jgi:glyoxylate/hydroxypyruvate reductase